MKSALGNVHWGREMSAKEPLQEPESWRCLHWVKAGPAGQIYRLVQGDASVLLFSVWASAHRPSLGNEFSNKWGPRGVNSGHPSPGQHLF